MEYKLSDYHTHILNKELERRLIAYDKLYAFVKDVAYYRESKKQFPELGDEALKLIETI